MGRTAQSTTPSATERAAKKKTSVAKKKAPAVKKTVAKQQPKKKSVKPTEPVSSEEEEKEGDFTEEFDDEERESSATEEAATPKKTKKKTAAKPTKKRPRKKEGEAVAKKKSGSPRKKKVEEGEVADKKKKGASSRKKKKRTPRSELTPEERKQRDKEDRLYKKRLQKNRAITAADNSVLQARRTGMLPAVPPGRVTTFFKTYRGNKKKLVVNDRACVQAHQLTGAYVMSIVDGAMEEADARRIREGRRHITLSPVDIINGVNQPGRFPGLSPIPVGGSLSHGKMYRNRRRRHHKI